jgi:hypothetical protein
MKRLNGVPPLHEASSIAGCGGDELSCRLSCDSGVDDGRPVDLGIMSLGATAVARY